MKNTIKQLMHSPRFVIGFGLFVLILLMTLIYPLINPGDPLEMIGVGTFAKPGTYVSLYDALDTRTETLRLADADDKRVASALKDEDRISMVNWFNAMGIDTHDVIEAAASKWNFIKLSPGLVGGHCISVDPYYLIQKAQVYGVLPRVMSSARRLNDGMGEYVANQVIKLMNKKGVMMKDSKILILGITFKENCPDIRNTKIVDIYSTLSEYTNNITIYDPWANVTEVKKGYNIDIINKLDASKRYDAAILGVAHKEFMSLDILSLLSDNAVVYDVKGILPREIVDGRL